MKSIYKLIWTEEAVGSLKEIVFSLKIALQKRYKEVSIFDNRKKPIKIN